MQLLQERPAVTFIPQSDEGGPEPLIAAALGLIIMAVVLYMTIAFYENSPTLVPDVNEHTAQAPLVPPQMMTSEPAPLIR